MSNVLEAGQLLDVVLDGGWRVPMKVVKVDEDVVDLAGIDHPIALPGGVARCAATLEWRSGIGAARYEGTLLDSGHGGLRLEPAGTPAIVQRRRFVRVRAQVAAAVIASDEQRLLTQTVDLSVGGMLLSNAAGLGMDDRVRFALDLGGATVSGEGHVVRGTPDGGRGVAFEHLNAVSERMLGRFVADRQREKARVA